MLIIIYRTPGTKTGVTTKEIVVKSEKVCEGKVVVLVDKLIQNCSLNVNPEDKPNSIVKFFKSSREQPVHSANSSYSRLSPGVQILSLYIKPLKLTGSVQNYFPPLLAEKDDSGYVHKKQMCSVSEIGKKREAAVARRRASYERQTASTSLSDSSKTICTAKDIEQKKAAAIARRKASSEKHTVVST